MFEIGILEKRFEYSYRYLKFFDDSNDKSWIDSFLELESNEQWGLPELLVLLHPKWYKQLDISLASNDPRGPKSFSSGPVAQPCASEKYWGYKCPVSNAIIHTDHIFPWSRGGATHFQNATYLCDEHNIMKFTDIHTMPWEILFEHNKWVRNSLEILIACARTKSELKFYFPETQLKSK